MISQKFRPVWWQFCWMTGVKSNSIHSILVRFLHIFTGWPRSGWPLSTTLCYKSVTRLNIHTELLLIFHMVGSDIRKVYWKFHNDNVNSFGVMGKGDAIFHPYFLVTMSHFKFSYFLNSCPHQIEVLEQFIDFWLHFKYDFIWFIGHLMQITLKMAKRWHFTKKLISLRILAKT